MRKSHASTLCVHGGRRSDRSDSVALPIYQTSAFRFADTRELIDYQEGRLERDEYGRYGNPTWSCVETRLAELESAQDAVLFSSGMSAAATLLMALLVPGQRLLIGQDCYRRTRQLCSDFLNKMSIEVDEVDPSDRRALEAALGRKPALFFFELPTNPFLRVADLEGIAGEARRVGCRVVVDATFATPINLRPLRVGADLVLHSATKYLAGHNDLLGGVVAGPLGLIDPIRQARGILGCVPSAQDAYLLQRGMKTLELRVRRHNDTALEIGRFLEGHPAVSRTYYPLLPGHPDFTTATRLLSGGGGVVTFELKGDFDRAVRFVDRCRIPFIAPSLGGVESLIEMPLTMSYWDADDDHRRRYGISDTLIRLSCGIESADDLMADLDQALRS